MIGMTDLLTGSRTIGGVILYLQPHQVGFVQLNAAGKINDRKTGTDSFLESYKEVMLGKNVFQQIFLSFMQFLQRIIVVGNLVISCVLLSLTPDLESLSGDRNKTCQKEISAPGECRLRCEECQHKTQAGHHAQQGEENSQS